jgi:integrase
MARRPRAPGRQVDSGSGAHAAAPLTVEQQRALLEHAGRYRPIILAALATGCRLGELLGLKWSDVDWRQGVIHVRREYSRGRFGPPKTKHAWRTVPMPQQLVSELKRWKLACPKGEARSVLPHGVRRATGRREPAKPRPVPCATPGGPAAGALPRPTALLRVPAHRRRGDQRQAHPAPRRSRFRGHDSRCLRPASRARRCPSWRRSEHRALWKW